MITVIVLFLMIMALGWAASTQPMYVSSIVIAMIAVAALIAIAAA